MGWAKDGFTRESFTAEFRNCKSVKKDTNMEDKKFVFKDRTGRCAASRRKSATR